MTRNKPHALDFFKKEIEYLQDSSIQGFFYNALSIAPQSFHDDEELLEHVKKAFHILRGLLEAKNIEGALRDALLGTTLICDIMYNEFDKDMRNLHPAAVRTYLELHEVDKDIQKGLWENIMRAVEAHEGEKGASPILGPKPGTAEFEVANAFALAHLNYIKVDWEVISGETRNER